MTGAVPDPTLEGKIAEVLDEHRYGTEERVNRDDPNLRDYGSRCSCGQWNALDHGGAHRDHLAAVLAPLVVEVRERAVEEAPDCLEHREVQHRDRKPPWCNTCGWNHGRAAVPPAKLGDPR